MNTRRHIALLGDSIFDNQSYVTQGESVNAHLLRISGDAHQVSLLAVDGAISTGVSQQVSQLPSGATHIALSVGGNDALECMALLETPVETVMQALARLSEVQIRFRVEYGRIAQALVQAQRPVLVCTIYDAVPGLTPVLITALSVFNDVITREAMRRGWPVLDLRELLCDSSDYSMVSPIEPSEQGGRKLAQALARWMLETPL